MKLDGYDYFAIICTEEEVVPWEYRENKVCVGALYPRSVTIYGVKCVQHGCHAGMHSMVNGLVITRRYLKSRNTHVSFINFSTSTTTSHVPSL
jgi:hypothetical protein